MRGSHYHKVLNFAHRGASSYAPENTLAAFKLAQEMGADGIELDVQLSRDGVPMVCHDYDLTKTTGVSGLVNDYLAEDLRQLDAGSWFDSQFADEHVPTLQEVIEGLNAEMLFNVELKTDAIRANGLEEAVAAVIKTNNLYDRLLVSSFNPLALRRLHRIDPAVDLALLHCDDTPIYLRRAWLRHLIPCQALHPEHTMIDAGYMRWARIKGYRVNTWTVDDPQEMRRLIDLAINGIITNKPDILQAMLSGEG